MGALCNSIFKTSQIQPPPCRVSSLSKIAFLDPNLSLQRQHQVLYIKQEGELARPDERKDSHLLDRKTTSSKPSSPVPTAGGTQRSQRYTVQCKRDKASTKKNEV